METLCFDNIELIIGLNPITYASLCTIKCFHDMFLSENKHTEYWKKKFGYSCRIYAPQDVDDGRDVEWKYRNAILGPRYIPIRGRCSYELLFGETTTGHQIIGRAIVRMWRSDIEYVPRDQILHCSGASAESHQKYYMISELERDFYLGLYVRVRGCVMIENIIFSIDCFQSEYHSVVPFNNICFSNILKNPIDAIISLTCRFPVETWRFVIGEVTVVMNDTWTDFCNSMREKYPEIHPEVMKFYHDLIFLLVERPRLASFLTVYEDHFRGRVSIPKVNFWRDDFSRPIFN